MGEQSFLNRLDRKSWTIGGLIFLFALAVRLCGIGWGLPNAERHSSFHPDEPVNIGAAGQISLPQGRLTPGFYNYGTFYLVLTNVASSVAVGYSGANPETTEGKIAQARAMLLGPRVLSSLAGAGLSLLAFLILFRRTHDLGAVLAGLAVAVAPGIVVHSRFATVDVPAAFFGTLSLYWACRMAPYPARGGGADEPPDDRTLLRFALYCGAAAGLSAACKYSGGLAVLALIPIVLALKGPRGLVLAAAGAGSALAVFVLGVPGIFLDSQAFWRDFSSEMRHVASGHGTVFMAAPNGFIAHLGSLFEGFGLLLTVLGAAGLARASWKGHSWAWGVGLYALGTYILLGRAEVTFLRYTFPLVPCLAVGAGWAAGQAHTHPRQMMKAAAALVMIGIGGVGGGGLIRSAPYTLWMMEADPREQAGTWLKTRIKPGEAVGLVRDPWFQTPVLYPQANDHAGRNWERISAAMAASPIPVVEHVPANPAERFDWDVRLLTEDRPEYVVFSSFESDDYLRIASSDPKGGQEKLLADRYVAFIDRLQKDYRQVEFFGSMGPAIHDLMYVRPRMWIWKRKGALQASSPNSSTSSSPSGG